MTTIQQRTADRLYDEAVPSFERWDSIREIIDEAIDLALNYRQSGHPGGPSPTGSSSAPGTPCRSCTPRWPS
jgi:hypothetical protein